MVPFCPLSLSDSCSVPFYVLKWAQLVCPGLRSEAEAVT